MWPVALMYGMKLVDDHRWPDVGDFLWKKNPRVQVGRNDVGNGQECLYRWKIGYDSRREEHPALTVKTVTIESRQTGASVEILIEPLH